MNRPYTAIDAGETFLKHYGILGMQWGVRRYQNSDGTLTGLAKSGSWDQKTGSSGSYLDSMKSDATAANGGGKLAYVYARDRNMNCSMCALTYEMRRRGYDVTANQVPYVERMNAFVNEGQNRYIRNVQESLHDPEYKRKAEDTLNVKDGTNTIVNKIDASLYNAAYKPVSEKAQEWVNSNTLQEPTKVFKNVTVTASCYGTDAQANGAGSNSISESQCASLEKKLISQGEGTRGQVDVVWAGSYSGHAMAYEIHDGKCYLIDGQSGDVFSGDDVYNKRLGLASSVVAYRVDNLELDKEYIKEHKLVTDAKDAQMNWAYQGIAKDKKLNDLEIEQAKPYHETPIDKAYIFLSQQKRSLEKQISEMNKKVEKDLENAQKFLSTLFK